MKAQPWQRNLFFVWLSQFLSIMGFGFAMPFVPFYMQDLGVTDPVRLKLWVSVFAGATPLMIAISAPLWGRMADRYGRRLMLLRANFCAAIILSLMGAVQSVPQLVVLRLLQGLFTGTMTAAQAMVVGESPEEHSGRALGSLSAAVFSGSMAGAVCGGFFAEWFGYRLAFGLSGLLLVAAGLVVLLGTTERCVRPARHAPVPPAEPAGRRLAGAWPLLVVLAVAAFTRLLDQPFLPLLVQEIHGAIEGAAMWTGTLNAVASAAGLLAGFALGPLVDRWPPLRMGSLAAAAAGLFMLAQAEAHSFPVLLAARFGVMFFAGGLEPAIHSWLARATPPHRRGVVFGFASSARSVGWFAAAMSGGGLAATAGIRAVFLTNALLYFLLIGCFAWMFRRPRPAGPGENPGRVQGSA